MRVAFLHSDKPRERILADAFLMGARKHGHETFAVALGSEEMAASYDVVAMVGVKSNLIYHQQRRRGVRVVMMDKGYARGNIKGGQIRKWEYWRVSVDAHSPTARLDRRSFPSDRWNRLGLEVAPWREAGSHILLAGSSAKYHEFHGMKDPTTYNRGVVRTLRGLTDRQIVYRPKPSWQDATPLLKTRYSGPGETIYSALSGAWATVTHGSNVCFESMLLGVPCIILGDGVTKPISSTNLDDIEAPRLASEAERMSLLHALAYYQWTEREFAEGDAWAFLGGELHG